LQIIPKKCAESRYVAACTAALMAIVVALAGCKPAEKTVIEPAVGTTTALRSCGESGYLRGRLYGAISASLEWGAADVNCEGMPRPDDRGARLRFAGSATGDNRQLAIIIAIPDLEQGSVGRELPSNVTIIEEGGGRFFSTPDLGNCLADITIMDKLNADADRYSIGGKLYCVSPLAEINGDSSVLIPELAFLGLVDWNSS
jgi:hypothetical protein